MKKQCSVCRLQVRPKDSVHLIYTWKPPQIHVSVNSQVRLPNSQVRKGNVPVKTTLEQAVSFVCSDSSLRTGEVEILQVPSLFVISNKKINSDSNSYNDITVATELWQSCFKHLLWYLGGQWVGQQSHTKFRPFVDVFRERHYLWLWE